VAAQAIELWDPRSLSSVVLASADMVRRNNEAALLPDGRVLFSGGADENGNLLTQSQIFDPQSQTVTVAGNLQSLQESGGALTEMRASSPQDGAQNVALNALISVRFSRPVQMASVSNSTVTLQGPQEPGGARSRLRGHRC
jgi:hypothetical protein